MSTVSRKYSAGMSRSVRYSRNARRAVASASALPLDTADMDELYDLPFNRAPHPMYADEPVPAFETVKSSLVIHATKHEPGVPLELRG